MHDQFTDELLGLGLRAREVFELEEEIQYSKVHAYPKEYYKMLSNATRAEAQQCDLAKPFCFYSSVMRIGFTERLNLLEREIVQHTNRKTKQILEAKIEEHQRILDHQHTQQATRILLDDQIKIDRLYKQLADKDYEKQLAVQQLQFKLDEQEEMVKQVEEEKEYMKQFKEAKKGEISDLKEEIRILNIICRDPHMHKNFLEKVDGMSTFIKVSKQNKVQGSLPEQVCDVYAVFNNQQKLLQGLMAKRFGK